MGRRMERNKLLGEAPDHSPLREPPERGGGGTLLSMCDPLPSQPSLSLPPAGLPQLQLHSRTAAAAQPVRASFFGVGAPEAILVGVVALVVFGPKGLAQAAKSLGSTLRSFAPTIRELTSVSQELKSTLEQVRFGVMPRWHAACLKSAAMQSKAGAVNHARQQQSVLLIH